MGLKTIQVELAEETDDVFLLVVKVLKDALSGKSILEIATGSLNELKEAIDGADKIDEEVKQNLEAVIRTISLRSGEVAAAFLSRAEPKPEGPNGGGDVV